MGGVRCFCGLNIPLLGVLLLLLLDASFIDLKGVAGRRLRRRAERRAALQKANACTCSCCTVNKRPPQDPAKVRVMCTPLPGPGAEAKTNFFGREEPQGSGVGGSTIASMGVVEEAAGSVLSETGPGDLEEPCGGQQCSDPQNLVLTANDGNIQYTRYCQVLCRPVDDTIGSPCLMITEEQMKEATSPGGNGIDLELGPSSPTINGLPAGGGGGGGGGAGGGGKGKGGCPSQKCDFDGDTYEERGAQAMKDIDVAVKQTEEAIADAQSF